MIAAAVAPDASGNAELYLSLSIEQDFPLWLGYATAGHGWCLSALGQTAEGIPTMLRGIAQLRELGANLTMPYNLMLLAESYEVSLRCRCPDCVPGPLAMAKSGSAESDHAVFFSGQSNQAAGFEIFDHAPVAMQQDQGDSRPSLVILGLIAWNGRQARLA
jgi:hypothetical protein